MPARIILSDGEYRHLRTYKHDFFAATGLYAGPSGKVILKLGRLVGLLGLPMSWLGRYLADRECAVYRSVADVPGVPRYLGRWGETGFVHQFVEGHPLQRNESVVDEFFPELDRLLGELHTRNVAYADLEKRENILVGDDGRPWLIDFQISWHWPPSGRQGGQRVVPDELGKFILLRLRQADRYHLLKHWRRHRADQLTVAQLEASYRRGFFVELHRRVTRPLTLLRRAALKKLTGRSRSAKQDGPEFLESSDAGFTPQASKQD
ncbi:MAG: hypothetical protein GXY44_14065 [Phycisphaerales bacterium]|nr:hypothetical protein [Phycisphaerales bacterium]